MQKTDRVDISTIFKNYAAAYLKKFQDKIPYPHQKAIYDICNCRTDSLGGHLDYCDNCGYLHFSYHSCYNRSCPQCQGMHARKWLFKQTNKLLSAPYFHIVFTVPHEVGELIQRNHVILLKVLFKALNISLKKIVKNSRYQKSVYAAMAVLHTWTRRFDYFYHPHIHCLVPGVVIYKTASGGWRFAFTKKKFFASVRALSRIFRAVFVRLARKEIPTLSFPQSIFKKEWVVYSKPTHKNEKKVLQYLSLYIYRTAISNSRIISENNSKITFTYKDSTHHKHHHLTLDALEFLRRFLMHILPPGFHKVRFYGFFSPAYKDIYSSLRMELAKLNFYGSLNSQTDSLNPTTDYIHICPNCKIGILRTIGHIYFKKNISFYRPPPNENI
jgi:hypothetical protein